MQVLIYDSKQYSKEEGDLCKMHKVPVADVAIDVELKRIHKGFSGCYPKLKSRGDFEFPDWHHNLRMFWAYLYHDDFYTPKFIPHIQRILQATPRSWFAQFECYTPTNKDESENPNGYVGTFLIYKETVIFSENKHWPAVRERMGINVA